MDAWALREGKTMTPRGIVPPLANPPRQTTLTELLVAAVREPFTRRGRGQFRPPGLVLDAEGVAAVRWRWWSPHPPTAPASTATSAPIGEPGLGKTVTEGFRAIQLNANVLSAWIDAKSEPW
jgi:hypothetical protein